MTDHREPCDKYPEIVQVLTETKTLVRTILANHLPHIETRVNETRRWVIAVFTAVIVAVILGGLKLFGVL